FSLGCDVVRDMTHALAADDIHVDLLLYVDGKFLGDTAHNRPENAGRVVNIVAGARIANEARLEGADNISVPEKWHFGTPAHHASPETRVSGLPALAGSAPPAEDLPTMPRPEGEPTPRPVAPRPEGARDEWDFLRPAPSSGRPPPPELPAPRPAR